MSDTFIDDCNEYISLKSQLPIIQAYTYFCVLGLTIPKDVYNGCTTFLETTKHISLKSVTYHSKLYKFVPPRNDYS